MSKLKFLFKIAKYIDDLSWNCMYQKVFMTKLSEKWKPIKDAYAYYQERLRAND